MDTFIIVYAAYATGTGEYGYMPFFAVFYSFLLGYLFKNEKSQIHKIQNSLTNFNKGYINFELSNK